MTGNDKNTLTRTDRRRVTRAPVYTAVSWRGQDDEAPKRAWIVETSSQGVGILTERSDTPTTGAVLTPERGWSRRLWDRPASVARIEQLSELLDLVALEYDRAPKQTGTPDWAEIGFAEWVPETVVIGPPPGP